MSLFKEIWGMMKARKRMWLLPVFLVLGLLSVLIIASQSSAVAPFIYTLF